MTPAQTTEAALREMERTAIERDVAHQAEGRLTPAATKYARNKARRASIKAEQIHGDAFAAACRAMHACPCRPERARITYDGPTPTIHYTPVLD